MLFQLLLSFLTSFGFGEKVYTCPDGWTNNTNCGYTACYYLIDADGTANTIVNNLCQKMNNLSYGVSIHCADERTFINRTAGFQEELGMTSAPQFANTYFAKSN
uniref:C-type lectin domain-containing protein n=1 Tax=Panagrellus redivivus TaxID=6233 RepID=A0A7E4UUF0_PANRE